MSEGNWRLLIFISLVLRFVRPHYHTVPVNRAVVRELHRRLVTPLRVAVLLLVALARFVVLPQKGKSSVQFMLATEQSQPSNLHAAVCSCGSSSSSHARNLQRRHNLSRRHA